ncbi:Protein arginine N-methyltransferase 5 [Babesia sp. Xinjiang]|uniref:Protein arginine N-methyltransferase 5 n=1 Tax=Babesia sp. Xinjiang TaxID=462227 RepID=UPI000A21D84A|nr:Protein arginine N-methyltransferase 5 [Babesia sp. Xinjiang]ORM40405.1 Protein arginine N-methyltransferase 5 [Babesia sp. Xinjiang]
MAPIEKNGAQRTPLIFGWNLPKPNTNDLLRIIKIIESVGISFVSLNLNSANDDEQDTFVPLCGSDLVLTYNYWSQRIVARIDNIGGAFKAYMEWAAYLGLRAVCIHCEPIFKQTETINEQHELLANLAQQLKAYLHSPNMPSVCISFAANDAAWGYWSAIHEMTNYSAQLRVAIVLDQDNHHHLERWVAEPLSAVILKESAFERNGDRVYLNRELVPYLQFLFKYDVKVMLSGEFNFKLLRDASQLRSSDSLELITLKDLDTPQMVDGIAIKEAIAAVKAIYAALTPLTEAEQFKTGFLDVLQEPLQPVRDNLETAIYENFERCTRKYAQFEEAITLWLKDFKAGTLPHQKDNQTQSNDRPVIYIVGAGRGPLVDCSLRALAHNNIEDFSIYALDKNPATVFTLKHKIATNPINGWNKVKLIFQDMRTLKPTEPADLVLSELMGSFADNELAPECLDGVQNAFHSHFPGHHVTFMPNSYISYVEPIYSPKLWGNLNSIQLQRPFQQPYTVALYKNCKIAEKPKPCFKFQHPTDPVYKWANDQVPVRGLCFNSNDHNNRYACITYQAKLDTFIHGFAGYFDSMLYNDIKMSTVPGVMDDQISWFPIFFPLVAPVYVKEGQPIMIHFWRKHDKRRVWYEWALTLPQVTIVHNSNGTCHSVLR